MVRSRARCNLFACGPANATAISSSLASLKSAIVYLFGTSLPRLSLKKGIKLVSTYLK